MCNSLICATVVLQDAKTLIILKFRSTHKLPSRGHIYDVLSPFGKVHMEDDIWFSEARSVAFVRYKWEMDASNAHRALERAGSAMFNLPEVLCLLLCFGIVSCACTSSFSYHILSFLSVQSALACSLLSHSRLSWSPRSQTDMLRCDNCLMMFYCVGTRTLVSQLVYVACQNQVLPVYKLLQSWHAGCSCCSW